MALDPHWQFHRCWSQAQAAVQGLIRSLVSDPHQAEDLLQETAMALFKSMDSYDDTRPFVAWALAVARNKVRDAWRAQRRAGVVLLEDAALEALAAVGVEINDELDREREALEVCLRQVSGRQRAVLERHYQQRQSAATIGQALGLKPEHVRVILGRIRESLRQCVRRQVAQA